ncbi:HNH endonuclease signature motif containing protein [Streptomyces rochei]|uniref:HNH endonuclease signature motif containing protein n=1 Tax=Streptomyces rochei TaxID=1928 RepID=UPI0036AE26DA
MAAVSIFDLPVSLQPLITDTGDCWIWTGFVRPDGYGKARGRQAHRVVYELLVAPIEDGLELDHLCRQIKCVNPAHLEPVTRQENIRRRFELVTHCKSGHKFTPENTYIRGNGHRACRACNNANAARYRAKMRRAV